MNSGVKYAALLSSIYFVLALIGILHHELWLDEAHHWLLSRDSADLGDMIRNTRAEGHPIFWNVILFFVTRSTDEPFFMQLLHIILSTIAVFIFIRFAPVGKLFKALFILGYFMLFEYNLISRNYALGVLLLFWACASMRTRHKNFFLSCLLLALVANVHLIFAVVCLAMFIALVVENADSRKLMADRYLNGYGIFLCGIFVAFMQIMPNVEDPGMFLADVPHSDRFTKGFISLLKGIFPMADFTMINWWNSNLIVNWSKPVAAILGALAYLIPVIICRRRLSLIFIYTALFGLQIFFFVTQRGAARFDGVTYLIIICGVWLDQYFKPMNRMSHRFIVPESKILCKSILYLILIVQAAAGLFAYSSDILRNFSGSKRAAEFISSRNLQASDIVSVFCEGTAVSPYIKKKIWFLCSNSQESFCRWNSNCPEVISGNDTASMLETFMANRKNVIAVLSSPINGNFPKDQWVNSGSLQIRFMEKFEGSIVRKSDYYIYEVIRGDNV